MQGEHLKRWLEEAMKKDRENAAANQEKPTGGMTTAGPNGTGGEGMEEIREKTTMEASNWERVVDLVQMAFGEGRLV